MFAFLFAVVASYTDIIIAGQCLFHVLQLMDEALLRAENIEIMVLHHLGNDRVTLSPTVAADRIAAVGVSQIVGGNGDRSRLIVSLATAKDDRNEGN